MGRVGLRAPKPSRSGSSSRSRSPRGEGGVERRSSHGARRFRRRGGSPGENLHVTLKFLGRTWPRLVDWVPEQMLRPRPMCPVHGQAAGWGASLPPRTGRALWAGFEETDLITDLKAIIEAGVVEEFPAEKRPFHPHLPCGARSAAKLPPEFAETPLLTEAGRSTTWCCSGAICGGRRPGTSRSPLPAGRRPPVMPLGARSLPSNTCSTSLGPHAHGT